MVFLVLARFMWSGGWKNGGCCGKLNILLKLQVISEGAWTMGKNTKRLSYKSSYKIFLLQHICFFILHVAGIGEYCFAVIFPSVYIISKSIPTRPQMIFALIIPLGFIIFAIIACVNVWRYGQEIVHLFSGSFLVKTGRVAEKSKNIYTIGPVLSLRKKTKFEPLSYPNFYIRDKNCESDFHVGDFIKIVYPCSRKLSVRTMHQLYAIYAFASDETYSINTQKDMGKEWKKAMLLFLLAVTLSSVSLLCALFALTNVLLKSIHIYP